MIRSRRSAARSLLLLRLVQACMRGSRLEMISVWLLFLRLLRATTGVRRPNENELTEGGRDSINQQPTEQEDLSKAVAMETSKHQDLGETQEEVCQHSKDAREWIDAYFSESPDTEKGNASVETRHTRSYDASAPGEGANQKDVTINDTEGENLNLKESVPSQEPGTDCHGQRHVSEKNAFSVSTFDAEKTEDRMARQATGEETDKREVFDANKTGHQVQGQPMEDAVNTWTNLSANVVHQQVQDRLVEKEPKSDVCLDAFEMGHPPKEQETTCGFSLDEIHEHTEGQVQEPPVERENNQSSSFEENKVGQEAQDLTVEEEIHSALGCDGQNTDCQAVDEKEAEHHVLGQTVEQDTSRTSSCADNETGQPEDDQAMENGADQDQDRNVADETQSTSTELLEAIKADHLKQDQQVKTTNNPLSFYGPSETGQQEQNQTLAEQPDHGSSFDPKETENQETVLEQQIKELAVSDASTESCQDNERDDLSDCLHVEMAVVLSDSDNEEQWKTMFSPVVDEDEFGAILESDLINQDLATEDEVTSLSETKAEPNEDEDPLSVPGSHDHLEQTTECPIECDMEDVSYDSIHYSSLSRIPEDDETAEKHNLQRLSASTSELDKRLPQDYCVIQEMKSEHVSTEHVDFKVARQQWKQMEEQSKGKGQTPALKHDPCQGGHAFMYTPVRNVERAKRDPDSDSPGLSLSDYQFTQFSPCSDDSGLDDTSYRSHYDEPETPVEREIRETMEREECFRRERAMARQSSDEPLQNKPRPPSLFPRRSDPDETKKTYNTREDRCRMQRNHAAQAPTLSFSASPSSKASYHEMVANSVIILEPDSHAASPQSRTNNLLSPVSPMANRFHEWPSDRSNVIILETSNLIIRSASEFCLSSACQETQESTFHNNPFFKLRSHSTQSLVDQEIREVRQRDEEFRRQRAQLYAREKYDTVLVSPSLLQSFSYDKTAGPPTKCKSSPSSPLRVRKMDRSTLSCDQKFPEAPCTRVRRKSALVQRWEAAVFSNQQQHL